jgi:soluble lytic murein transglycosylase-like protein
MSLIEYFAERVGWPADLGYKQMMAESAANPKAKSPAGAIGLFQLMPATAAELKVDPWNPEENIKGGLEYDARQKASVQVLLHGTPVADEDVLRFALASYNCGYGYVRVAIKMALELGHSPTWPNVSACLPKAVVRGRTPDVKQVTTYVSRILPIVEA